MFTKYDIANYISEEFPWIGRILNEWAINEAVNVSRYRPHPWSTVHNYVSWTSLTDKNWDARHLPANEKLPANSFKSPAIADVVKLFERGDKEFKECPKSTCLFPAFAQYLTDGFIRTRMPNRTQGEMDDPLRKQNTSNHNIDLSALYGRTAEQISVLRLQSQQEGKRGKLKFQFINGEEYAPFLFKEDGSSIKEEFEILDVPLLIDKITEAEKRKTLFAFGGDRANASPQIAMMNTLFLREHNRLASLIEQNNPSWDDDRVFETARNTNIVLFIKIIVEEYINHISPTYNKFIADPSVAWYAPWNKPNWITIEFSLLYRWHQLIPDSMNWHGNDYPVEETILNNDPFLKSGLKNSFIKISSQVAGKIGAFNTSNTLIGFESSAINQGRLCQLTSYNDYREYVSLPRLETFLSFSKNDKVANLLSTLYDTTDDIEFYVGLFAEDAEDGDILPPVIGKLVAVDAFTQALTNPLLSKHVFKEETFSTVGWETIQATKKLRDIVNRNVPEKLNGNDFIGMTRQDWSKL